jgi:hypothetical protein
MEIHETLYDMAVNHEWVLTCHRTGETTIALAITKKSDAAFDIDIKLRCCVALLGEIRDEHPEPAARDWAAQALIDGTHWARTLPT